jgi:uncharacterized membrane protein
MFFLAMHIIHVLTVVLWIGGLAFVTIIVLPVIIKTPDPLQKVLTFHRIEKKFAALARVYVVVTGLTGFAMLFSAGWAGLLFTRDGIALTFMLMVWVFWMAMLFGIEPIVIKKMLERLSKSGDKMEIETVFSRMNRMHVVLLIVSLVATVAGVLTAHN